MKIQKFLGNIHTSKLSNKFILIFIILAGVPILVLGSVSLYLINLSHRYDVSRLELQLIDQKIKEVQKFFVDTLGSLELKVSTDKNYIEARDQSFLLEELLKNNRAFEEISFIEPKHGRETEKKTRSEKSGEEISLENILQLDKFTKAIQSKNFISEIHHTLSGPMLTISSQVRNRNDEIISVISAEVNLSPLLRSIEAERLGSTGYLILIDNNGDFVGGGRPSLFLPGTPLVNFSRIKEIMAGKTFDALGEKDRYKSIFSNTAVVGAGKKIAETGWVLMAEWPLEDANSIIHDVSNEIIQFTLFIILAVLILAYLFAARLIRPIKELEEGAQQIEQGNFVKQVNITSHDELEELGGAFNRMAQGLKRLQELKNEFVFIAAHELRSPVTVINGYISMIFGDKSTGLLTTDLKDYLEQIKLANQRLLQLVTDLLEVARSEAGRIEIEVFPVSVQDAINQTVAEMKPIAQQKSIAIYYEELPNLPRVIGNDARIKEIIINILSNAVKYSPEGKPIKIYHEIKEKEVITHIQDNGFGISEEAQKKLFEKFYRVRTEKTQSVPGTGLGLFIIKQLVEKMNGKIWVKSEENTGSTFSFSLPQAPTPHDNPRVLQ